MQKGPDDPDLCSPDGRLSSSHYTPRGLFHFKYRQSYNKSILPRRGLLRKGKRDPDHPWLGAALASNPLAWGRSAARLPGVVPVRCCSVAGLAGVAPVWHQTHWLGAATPLLPGWLDAATPLLPGWLPLLLGWIRFPL